MSQIVQATQASPTSQVAITPGAKRKLRNRVGLGHTIRDTWIMAYRGLLKVRRTPEQLFDVIFQPIIFTLLFSQIFGGAIAGTVQGYLPILIPGLLAQTVLTTTSVTGTQLREDMDKGVFDRFKSLPIARIAPLAGALLTDTVRYLIATTLTIATGFGKTSRDVMLDGEAYFELRNGSSSLPFVVHTGVVTTRVLGTAFNVRRYRTDTRTRVSVTSGKVSVVARTAWRPSVTLTAGGIADVTDSTTGIVSADSAARYAQWTAGTLVFDEAPIAEVLETLGRWYGYEFRLADSTMARRKLTAWFTTHAPEEALSDLKTLLEVELKFDGKIVTLLPRTRKSSRPAIQNTELSHILTEVGR